MLHVQVGCQEYLAEKVQTEQMMSFGSWTNGCACDLLIPMRWHVCGRSSPNFSDCAPNSGGDVGISGSAGGSGRHRRRKSAQCFTSQTNRGSLKFILNSSRLDRVESRPTSGRGEWRKSLPIIIITLSATFIQRFFYSIIHPELLFIHSKNIFAFLLFL